MSIFSSAYKYPNEGYTGGHGGESGGGGASGTWEPAGESCPDIISCPYDRLEAWALGLTYDTENIYFGESLFGCPSEPNSQYWFLDDEDGSKKCQCYAGVTVSKLEGPLYYSTYLGQMRWGTNNAPRVIEVVEPFIPYVDGTLLEYPIDSEVFNLFTIDHPLTPVNNYFAFFLYRHSSQPDTWLTEGEYADLYSQEPEDYCGAAWRIMIATAWFKFPLPFFIGGVRGGVEGQLITQALGLSIGVSAIPAFDIVARNARRSRRHRLLGGNKEII